MIEIEIFKRALTALLAEAFGVSDNPHGFFLDDGQAGLLGTIDKLDAAKANAALKPENETITSHCGHVLYLVQSFMLFEQGQFPKMDWPGSWHTRNVDAAAWAALRTNLRSNYERLNALLQMRTDWPEPAVSAYMMLLAHVSYHVGEIKQILTSLR